MCCTFFDIYYTRASDKTLLTDATYVRGAIMTGLPFNNETHQRKCFPRLGCDLLASLMAPSASLLIAFTVLFYQTTIE